MPPDASPIPVRTEDARVRPDRRDALEDLIERLYRRRSHTRLSTWDQMRHAPEIADYLRRRSRVYRELSGDEGTAGPLPFALGCFRITPEGTFEPVADALRDPQEELLAQLLSEFLQPGARLVFGRDKASNSEAGGLRVWHISGEGEVRGPGGQGDVAEGAARNK